MSDFEKTVANSLRNRAEAVPAATDGLADGALTRLRRRQFLRAGIAGVAGVAIIISLGTVLSGGVSGPVPTGGPATGPPAPNPHGVDGGSSPSHNGSFDGPAAAVDVTQCRAIPHNEPPGGHGADTSFDPESYLIEIWYTVKGENRHHVIDYVDDETCGAHPRLRRLITDVVYTAAEVFPKAPPPAPPWHESGATEQLQRADVDGDGSIDRVGLYHPEPADPDVATPFELVVHFTGGNVAWLGGPKGRHPQLLRPIAGSNGKQVLLVTRQVAGGGELSVYGWTGEEVAQGVPVGDQPLSTGTDATGRLTGVVGNGRELISWQSVEPGPAGEVIQVRAWRWTFAVAEGQLLLQANPMGTSTLCIDPGQQTKPYPC